MRKVPVLAISLFLIALLLVSCGGGDSTAPTSSRGSGSIAFRLGSANLQAVGPIVSARVEVLNPDTLQEVLPAQSLVLGEEVFFSPVPVGFQLVRATGFNADGDLSATDEEVVEVRQGETSRATLVLTPPLPDPEPEPTPTTPPATLDRLVYVDYIDGMGGGQLTALDPQTYQPVATVDLMITPQEFTIDEAGERIFLVGGAGDVLVYNARDLAPLPTVPIGGDAPYGVAYDPDREKVYVGDSAGSLFDIEIAPPNTRNLVPVSSAHEVIYFENHIYVAGTDSSPGTNSFLAVLDADTLTPFGGSPFTITSTGQNAAKHLALDEVNRRIYIGAPTVDTSSQSVLAAYDIDTPGIMTLSVGNAGSEVTGVDYDPAQNRILLSFNDGTVEIYDAGALSTPIQITSTGPLYDVLVDNTENRILNTRSNAPLLESLDNTTNLPIPGSPFTIAPTGNMLRNIEIGDF